MPISVQNIVNRCNSFLDAEGSDRYTFDRDYIFAINSSIEWIVEQINSVYSVNKFPAEYLKELTKIKVFRTSDLSRVYINVPNEEIWNILSVYPKANIRAINSGISATATIGEDVVINGGFDTDLSGWTNWGNQFSWDDGKAKGSGADEGEALIQQNLIIGQQYTIDFDVEFDTDGLLQVNTQNITTSYQTPSIYASELLTTNQHVSITLTAETEYLTFRGEYDLWIDNIVVRRVIPTTETALYYNAEYIGSNYFAKRLTVEQWNKRNRSMFTAGSNLNTIQGYILYAYLDYLIYNNVPEVEIAPSIPNEAVAISYLKVPNTVELITDTIEFPTTLTDLFVKKTLNNIAIKQGDTVLRQITDNDIANILNKLV